MAFDYNKLRGRIGEIFNTQSNFASAMGWSERSASGFCTDIVTKDEWNVFMEADRYL